MIKRNFICGLALLLPLSALSCELPDDQEIRLGCTYKCDFFYRLRLKTAAKGLGYKLKLINLQRNETDLRKVLSSVDAVLIPGGADIHPKYYLEGVSSELQEYTKANLQLVHFSPEGEERDPFEYSLVRTYSAMTDFKHLPMLGICRGFQMMAVAQGIPLYLDIKTELGLKNRYNRFDLISMSTGPSVISSLYRSDNIRGFKFHHQGVRVPYYEANKEDYPLARITAYSHERRIAEAIEYTHRPALGVQYHPEKSLPGTSAPVFRWLLKKACEYKKISMKEIK